MKCPKCEFMLSANRQFMEEFNEFVKPLPPNPVAGCEVRVDQREQMEVAVIFIDSEYEHAMAKIVCNAGTYQHTAELAAYLKACLERGANE